MRNKNESRLTRVTLLRFVISYDEIKKGQKFRSAREMVDHIYAILKGAAKLDDESATLKKPSP